MSNLNSKTLPENIRRCMPTEQRKQLAIPTNDEANAKFVARREKELQNQIANLLRQRNVVFFQQRMDKRTTGRVGQPDFIFAIRGRACAVECKMPFSYLTVEQGDVLTSLICDGWHIFVARGLDEFIVWLNAMEATEARNG